MIEHNVEIVVHHKLPSDTSFAVRKDNGEGVFVSSNIVKRNNMEIGASYYATLVPNANSEHVSRTPWFVTFAKDAIDDEEEMPSPELSFDDLAKRCHAQIINDGYQTTTEIASAIGAPVESVGSALMSLHSDGKIARADIYKTGSQKRASFRIWAETSRDFLE